MAVLHSRKLVNARGLTSMVAGLSFLIMVLSGLVLYLTPRGRYANWNDWSWWGLAKEQWSSMHMTMALLFLAAIAVHIWFNWRILVSYIKRRGAAAKPRWRELVIAVAVTGFVVLGTLGDAPVFREVSRLNTAIKDAWEKEGSSAPGHRQQRQQRDGADRKPERE